MQAVWCPDQQSRDTSTHRDHPKSSHSGAGIILLDIQLSCSYFLFQHLGAGKTKADVPGFDLPNVEDLLWGQVKLEFFFISNPFLTRPLVWKFDLKTFSQCMPGTP